MLSYTVPNSSSTLESGDDRVHCRDQRLVLGTLAAVLPVFLKSVLFKVTPVHGQMASKLVGASKSLGAVGPGADVGLFAGVGAHVCLEVVGAGELALADFALEGTDAGVLAAVSSELVGAGEALAAALVLAHIGLFTSVLPDVHLEVRELEVTLGAAGIEADEWFTLLVVLGGGHGLADEAAVRGHAVGGEHVARSRLVAKLSGVGEASGSKVIGSCSGNGLVVEMLLLPGVTRGEGEDGVAVTVATAAGAGGSNHVVLRGDRHKVGLQCETGGGSGCRRYAQWGWGGNGEVGVVHGDGLAGILRGSSRGAARGTQSAVRVRGTAVDTGGGHGVGWRLRGGVLIFEADSKKFRASILNVLGWFGVQWHNY